MVNIVKKDRNPKYWSNSNIFWFYVTKIKYFSIYFNYDNFKILFVFLNKINKNIFKKHIIYLTTYI